MVLLGRCCLGVAAKPLMIIYTTIVQDASSEGTARSRERLPFTPSLGTLRSWSHQKPMTRYDKCKLFHKFGNPSPAIATYRICAYIQLGYTKVV